MNGIFGATEDLIKGLYLKISGFLRKEKAL
jgi:hypothetical protein